MSAPEKSAGEPSEAKAAFDAGDFGLARRLALRLRAAGEAARAEEILWRLRPDPVAGLCAVLGLLFLSVAVYVFQR